MALYGVLQNLLPSASVLRSSRLTWSLRTRRSVSMNYKSKLLKMKITFNPLILYEIKPHNISDSLTDLVLGRHAKAVGCYSVNALALVLHLYYDLMSSESH